jgi:hypothetical protein
LKPLDWTPAGVYPDENRGRRDEFEASSLFVIPAPYRVWGRLQPESSGIKEEFDVYTIMALLIQTQLIHCHSQVRDSETSSE